MRAAIYLRISQDRSGQEAGVGRQLEDCRRLAEDRGWRVVTEYRDNDTSAYSGKSRPQFDAMLRAANSGEFDVIVAYHVDRLYRRLRDLVPLLEVCERKGVQVATVKAGDMDLGTAAGRMMAGILGSVAEGESARQAERIKREKEARAIAGKANGSMRSFGYEVDGGLHAVEAPIVRDLVERYIAGESMRSLTKWLIDNNVPTVRGGKVWRDTNLRESLRSPKLAGMRVHHGKVVARGGWEPIISMDQHEQVIARGSTRTRSGKAPLTGVLICGRCERSLNSHSDRKGGRRYMCIKTVSSDRCGGISITADRTDEWVRDSIAEAIYGQDGNLIPRPVVEQVATPIPNEDEIRGKLKKLALMYASDELTEDEWLVQRQVLETRLTAGVEIVPQRRAPELPKSRDLFIERWAQSSADVRRAMVQAVLHKIVVEPRGKTAPGFDPTRLVFDWI